MRVVMCIYRDRNCVVSSHSFQASSASSRLAKSPPSLPEKFFPSLCHHSLKSEKPGLCPSPNQRSRRVALPPRNFGFGPFAKRDRCSLGRRTTYSLRGLQSARRRRHAVRLCRRGPAQPIGERLAELCHLGRNRGAAVA